MSDLAKLMDLIEDFSHPAEKRVAAGREILELVGNVDRISRFYGIVCQIFGDEKENVDVRLLAVNALEQFADVNHLVGITKDPRVRLAAIAALTRIGATKLPDRLKSDLDELQARLESDSLDNNTCTLMNLPLVHGRDPDALRMLRKCLISGNPTLRLEAVQSLALLGELDALTIGMRDPSPSIRSLAASLCPSLANGLLDETGIALLKQLKEDVNLDVQNSATTALKRLGLLPKPKQKSKSVTQSQINEQQGKNKFAWRQLMERWSRLCLEDEDYLAEVSDEAVENSWLGYPGASAEELADLEGRLGLPLPPSYREFLELSNGWRRINFFIASFLPTQEVDFFQVKNQEWIDAWLASESEEVSDEEYLVYGPEQDTCVLRSRYLQAAIEISDNCESTVILLNSQVVDANGEWEAWFFANWMAGAQRYSSFWQLMAALYKDRCESE